MKNTLPLRAAAFGVVFGIGQAALATVTVGPGGRGVTVGNSSLISTLDFSDTFTGTDSGGQADRPYAASVQPLPAYEVENEYGNPANQFRSRLGNPPAAEVAAQFSFASGSTPGSGGLVQGNASSLFPGSSGAGSDTGFTQTGGGVDYGITYGLRDNYLVQVDATGSPDRIDITSAPTRGSIFQANSLSVFFRGHPANDATNGNNISLFNGTTDTPLRGTPGFENLNTGLAGSREWHNYAVRFDAANEKIEIYVDEVSLGIVDLNTFAGGIYAGFSNAAVGAGGSVGAGNRIWTDNFQVGAPVPEPTGLGLVAAAALLANRRRRPV